MNGYQLTFYTQQERQHEGLPVGEWLMREARRLGLQGATLSAAAEGLGHDRKLHAIHFFDLADQPVIVSMALTASEAEQLFARLHEEELNIFYVKIPIEFGMSAETR